MLRPDLEENYEETQENGTRLDPYNKAVIPVGRCHRLCPIHEMEERERTRRLHKYEQIPGTDPPRVDFELCMKEFRRSSVGRETAASNELRPWSLLRKGLSHLLLNICLKEDDEWMFIGDFVFDRIKAIRQDMVIQRIEGKRYVEVLEGSIRFFVYSMYRLTCTSSTELWNEDSFKPAISTWGAVTGLTHHDLQIVQDMKLTMKGLRESLISLMYQYRENVPDSPNRSIFEAINLIANLPFLHGSLPTVTEFFGKEDLRDNHPAFKIVSKMYREHLSGNHLSAMKHLPKLVEYPLLVLAYAPVLARLQLHMISLLKHLYSHSSSNVATLEFLTNLLCPAWLEVDFDERLKFVKFLAIQVGVYDSQRNLCDFRNAKQAGLDQIIRRPLNSQQYAKQEGENETREYAFQLMCSRNWSFYREVISLHGIRDILDPFRQDSCTK